MAEDYKQLLRDTVHGLSRLRESTPDQMKSFYEFMDVVESKLDKKTVELIAIAIAIKDGCEYCLVAHVRAALKAGLSKDEILSACWVAVVMGGGPAMMHLQVVEKIIDEFNTTDKGDFK
ncbi:carboxymuconolactone decarboxylase family protein [Candidatus Woesearchaeota archaeon]|nr:carboxymuconolactone decarboxylase family protein [Candidatus Woesearchaeota archaeon]